MKTTRRRTRSDVKIEGGEEEKYGRKKRKRDVGKEALNYNDENDDQRDRRRRRRGDGETSAHPLLSITLSPYSLFYISNSHYSIFCIILTGNAERTVLVLLEPSPRTSHLTRLTIP